MMKFKFATLLFFLASLWNQEFCQQWIDKTYNYDSTYNVVYGSSINFNGVLESHKMDIFTPLCDDDQHISTRPLLLWIHGGAFLAGDKNDPSIINMCKQFAQRGYVTASIDYRLGFIADDQPWDCTYPNYKCVFATDTSEWYRALFRSIQDGKGALRYLLNRNLQFRIDTNNVFVAGESAGAFVALGIGLLDTVIEKFAQAYALTEVARPNSNAFSCVYNVGLTFNNTFISRPDLGNIEGNIESSNIKFKLKGIGNFYGGLASDFLKYSKSGLMKPAIYSFHQPCDLVVPIDSGRIFSGLSWCMTNGYNCFDIANTAKVYGSRMISKWNTANNYGYNILSEFTTTDFPYNFLFGTGSCLDQVNNPCHAYDNVVLRENNLAKFFSKLVTTNPICNPDKRPNANTNLELEESITIFPNPISDKLFLQNQSAELIKYTIFSIEGKMIHTGQLNTGLNEISFPDEINAGLYLIKLRSKGTLMQKTFIKVF